MKHQLHPWISKNISANGGFLKCGTPESMVCKGKSENRMDDVGVPPFYETPQLDSRMLKWPGWPRKTFPGVV